MVGAVMDFGHVAAHSHRVEASMRHRHHLQTRSCTSALETLKVSISNLQNTAACSTVPCLARLTRHVAPMRLLHFRCSMRRDSVTSTVNGQTLAHNVHSEAVSFDGLLEL